MPSSRGYSQPRDRTQDSHIAGRFFTIWATREAHTYTYTHIYRLTHISTCTHTNTYIQRKKIIPKIQCPLKKKRSDLTVYVFSNPIYACKYHLGKTYNVSVTGKVPLSAFSNSHSPETSYFLSSITADEFSLSLEFK